jgi:hypothetical protein
VCLHTVERRAALARGRVGVGVWGPPRRPAQRKRRRGEVGDASGVRFRRGRAVGPLFCIAGPCLGSAWVACGRFSASGAVRNSEVSGNPSVRRHAVARPAPRVPRGEWAACVGVCVRAGRDLPQALVEAGGADNPHSLEESRTFS